MTVTTGQTACGTGAFEVVASGHLLHSKLTVPGHGKCQTDEARAPTGLAQACARPATPVHTTWLAQELDNIIAKLRALTG